jgi:hypothetical protein
LALLLFLFFFSNDAFVVNASTSASYVVDLPRESLRSYVDDIGLFARNMPGVVSVTPSGENRFLYQTEKKIPLAGTMTTDFLIQKSVVGDSVTIYESVDAGDPNYMHCSVMIRPETEWTTSIHITLKLRLSRESGSDIHWLAPVLGASFIEARMKEDMEGMMESFIENSNKELYSRLPNQTPTRQ